MGKPGCLTSFSSASLFLSCPPNYLICLVFSSLLWVLRPTWFPWSISTGPLFLLLESLPCPGIQRTLAVLQSAFTAILLQKKCRSLVLMHDWGMGDPPEVAGLHIFNHPSPLARFASTDGTCNPQVSRSHLAHCYTSPFQFHESKM